MGRVSLCSPIEQSFHSDCSVSRALPRLCGWPGKAGLSSPSEQLMVTGSVRSVGRQPHKASLPRQRARADSRVCEGHTGWLPNGQPSPLASPCWDPFEASPPRATWLSWDTGSLTWACVCPNLSQTHRNFLPGSLGIRET